MKEIVTRTRAEVFKLWVEALESGKYRQTQGQLREKVGGRYAYCCLGVLCKLAEQDGGEKFYGEIYGCETKLPPKHIMEFMFDDGEDDADDLANLNDNEGYTFKQIAEYIRKNHMKEQI